MCSLRDDSAAPVSKKQRPANPVIETIIQEEAAQPPVPDTDYELRAVNPTAPPQWEHGHVVIMTMMIMHGK